MGNEVILKEDVVTIISKLEKDDLPTLINTQVDKLKELDESVKEAMKAADKAKMSAQNANEKSAGFGKKKVAIEELQSASIDMAKAIQIGAEAQLVSFDFQTKLSEITKYLIGLGMSNIANNRMVVRELEKRLKGASEEEISELAQQELMLVIHQLKEQEDLLRKIDNLSASISDLKEKLIGQFEYSRGLNEKLFEHQFTLEKYADQLANQTKINQEVEEKFKTQIEFNRISDKNQALQVELNLNYEEQLKNLQSKSRQFSQQFEHVEKSFLEIGKNSEVIDAQLAESKLMHEQHQQNFMAYQKVHESVNEKLLKYAKSLEQNHLQIQQLVDENETLRSIVDTKSSKKFSKVTLAFGAIGTILSIVHFII